MLASVAGIALFAAATPGPTPSPTPTLPIDPNLVTPGVWGFVAIAFIAVAVIALISDMMRRIRRGRYRADVRAELDAEEDAQRQADAAAVDPSTGSGTAEVDGRRSDPSTGSETDDRPRP